MPENRKTTGGTADERKTKTDYSIETWAMCLALFVSGGIVFAFWKEERSVFSALVSSVAALAFALVVVAIIDARKDDRSKYHDWMIKEAEAERAKAEKETEDRKCEESLRARTLPNRACTEHQSGPSVSVSTETTETVEPCGDLGEQHSSSESGRPEVSDRG